MDGWNPPLSCEGGIPDCGPREARVLSVEHEAIRKRLIPMVEHLVERLGHAGDVLRLMRNGVVPPFEEFTTSQAHLASFIVFDCELTASELLSTMNMDSGSADADADVEGGRDHAEES